MDKVVTENHRAWNLEIREFSLPLPMPLPAAEPKTAVGKIGGIRADLPLTGRGMGVLIDACARHHGAEMMHRDKGLDEVRVIFSNSG
jgi:hypothetical protein